MRENKNMLKPKTLQFAKLLRKTQTDAELRLWYFLRGHRFQGFKFKRQKPIGDYIIDFACLSLRLIIEIDGSQHMQQAEYDNKRTLYLEDQGFLVLRFWSHDVLRNTEAVLEVINRQVEALAIKESVISFSHTPSPGASRHPLPQAGEENPAPSSLQQAGEDPCKSPLPLAGEQQSFGKSPLPLAGEGGRRPGEGFKETR